MDLEPGGCTVPCHRCLATEEEKRLEFCPTCRKPFCDDCTYVVGGKDFCCKGCGYFFFFGEGEEDVTEDQ